MIAVVVDISEATAAALGKTIFYALDKLVS